MERIGTWRDMAQHDAVEASNLPGLLQSFADATSPRSWLAMGAEDTMSAQKSQTRVYYLPLAACLTLAQLCYDSAGAPPPSTAQPDSVRATIVGVGELCTSCVALELLMRKSR